MPWRKARFNKPPYAGLEIWVKDEEPVLREGTNKVTGQKVSQFMVKAALINDQDQPLYMRLTDLDMTPEYTNMPEFITLAELQKRAEELAMRRMH